MNQKESGGINHAVQMNVCIKEMTIACQKLSHLGINEKDLLLPTDTVSLLSPLSATANY